MKKFTLVAFVASIYYFGWLSKGFGKIYSVASVNDAGVGSLRQAIVDANFHLGLDTIRFSIPKAPFKIRLLTILDPIKDTLLIDGTSQPGYTTGGPLVNVNLSSGGGAIFDFLAGAAKSTLKGLIISGGNRAVFVEGCNGIRVLNNFIGTDSSGTTKGTSFSTWAIFEINNAKNTLVSGNVISGSNEDGLRYSGGNCTGSIVTNNYFGTDKNGTAALPNARAGIAVYGGTDFSNSRIGGSTPDSSNVISKNQQQGLNIGGGTNVFIVGNIIGLDKSGTLPLGNGGTGIEISNCSKMTLLKNTVQNNLNNGVFVNNGGAIIIKGNTISGNAGLGINMNASLSPVIQGNIIGLLKDGISSNADSSDGIGLAGCKRAVVGGTLAGQRNTISSNHGNGIVINAGSDSSLVQGNNIGTDASGLAAKGNRGNGILVIKSVYVQIGGTRSQGNIIAGNKGSGLDINTNSDFIKVQGNIVGMDSSGTNALANGGDGLHLDACKYALIGGVFPAQRNVFSANKGSGIYVGAASDSAVIAGNYVGTDVSGLKPFGNLYVGISVQKSKYVIVGGSVGSARNIVTANKNHGIFFGDSANFGRIQGNFAGLDKNGGVNLAMGNQLAGINLEKVSNILIGGLSPMERNVTSQNGYLNLDTNTAAGSDGIRILQSTKLTVINNFCGTDSSGLRKAGNRWAGISINESTNSVVTGNYASGNRNEGVYIRNIGNSLPENILVKGNFIGLGSDQTTPIGNEDYGVNMGEGANLNNTIVNNTIAYSGFPKTSSPSYGSGGSGILSNSKGQFNLFTNNSIFCNITGISLDAGANESVKAPTLDFSNNSLAKGTATPGNTVDIYNNPGSCNCQGKVFLGSTVVDVNGNWSFTHNLGAGANSLTATQTTLNKSTSVFSPCCIAQKISGNPISKAVCAGGAAVFSGSSLTGTVYKWVERKPGGKFAPLAEGGVYTNVNTNTISLSGIPATMDQYEYRLVVYSCAFTDSSASAFLSISHPKLSLSGDTAVCSGSAVLLTAGGAKSYLWKPSIGLNRTDKDTVIASPLKLTRYSVIGQDSIGCTDSLQKQVAVNQTPLMLVPDDTTIYNGGSLAAHLNSTGVKASNYKWTAVVTAGNPYGATNGNGLSMQQVLYNPESNAAQYTYTVTGVYQQCVSPPVKFRVNVIGGIRIPDVFSPNNDGKNDVFTFTGTSQFKITIYNRWGGIVYEGDEHSNKWDGHTAVGERCTEGTYYYILNARDLNNKIFNGFVTLLHQPSRE